MIDQLTPEEKAALVSGTEFVHTNPIPRLGIPGLCMADGPHGLRKQIGSQDNGISLSEEATAFPTAAAVACSFDPENSYKIARAIAEECNYYGVQILLGPGVNIKRNPLCGRNFEYFSEDPLLSGSFGASFVKGAEEQGVGTALKHFALNNAENFRFVGNSFVDERAAREIYLKSFEKAIKEGHPSTVMCAYNQINGEFCSQNKWLLEDVLRKEWGYDGLVMTDWGATKDRVKGIIAGLDLEMPGDSTYCRHQILQAEKESPEFRKRLDDAAANVLKLVERFERQKPIAECNFENHHELAVEVSCDSAVLLKNEHGALPLNPDKPLAVIGDLFRVLRYQGAGSSMIRPHTLSTFENSFKERKIQYRFLQGYREDSQKLDEKLINDAVESLKSEETVLVFAGLTDYLESEGGDRSHMRLPENQIALIESLIKAKKKITLILFGGSPIELPFIDDVQAVLLMYLAGEGVGEATSRLLFGEANPSGKLAETWPLAYSAVAFSNDYSRNVNELYKESIFVGYRYYGSKNIPPKFCFGYGLSYTTFGVSDIEILNSGGRCLIEMSVKNTGQTDGAEVIQVYVRKNRNSKVFKAEKELRAFMKVRLNKGESKRVSLSFKERDLAYYNVAREDWILENGEYVIEVATSYETVIYSEKILISDQGETESPYGETVVNAYNGVPLVIQNRIFEDLCGKQLPQNPPLKPLTFESRFIDFKHSFLGNIMFNAVSAGAHKMIKEAKKMPDGIEKSNKIKGGMFLLKIFETNSVRTFSMSAGNQLKYNLAEGMLLLANGHVFKGIKRIRKEYPVPPLPKEKEKEVKRC